jgi:hypothetical protein
MVRTPSLFKYALSALSSRRLGFQYFPALDNLKKIVIVFSWERVMEEMEVTSWIALDALKKSAEIVETVGNLQTGHSLSVFCFIEDDYFELLYSDAASNHIRHYEDKDDFQAALEERKEDIGETPYEEDQDFDEDLEEEEEEREDEGLSVEDESETF